jgi:mycoredoxin-dependent peroxiredoxin
LSGLGQVAEKVAERGGTVLAISADSTFCHTAFHDARRFPFPLLSDVHRTVIRAYNVLDEDRNVAWRSTFVIDRDGILRWGQAGDRQMVRDGSEILRVVDVVASLRSKS